MTTAEARRHRLYVFAALVAAAVAGVWVANHEALNETKAFAHKLCLNVAASRRQGNVRGDVIKAFLLAAARARASSAELERRSNKREAAVDARAARLYLDLAARVKHSPPPVCA